MSTASASCVNHLTSLFTSPIHSLTENNQKLANSVNRKRAQNFFSGWSLYFWRHLLLIFGSFQGNILKGRWKHLLFGSLKLLRTNKSLSGHFPFYLDQDAKTIDVLSSIKVVFAWKENLTLLSRSLSNFFFTLCSLPWWPFYSYNGLYRYSFTLICVCIYILAQPI